MEESGRSRRQGSSPVRPQAAAPLADAVHWRARDPRSSAPAILSSTDVDAPELLKALAASVGLAQKAVLEPTWQLGDEGLASGLALVGMLRTLVERIEVSLAADVLARGTADAEGLSPTDWIVAHEGDESPRPDVRHVSRVLGVARAIDRTQPGAEPIAAAFCAGRMPLSHAATIGAFVRDVRAVADLETLEATVAVLATAASDEDGVRGLTSRDLATAVRYATQLTKPADDLEKDEDRLRLARALWRQDGPAGMTAYRLLLDPEGAAIVDAAVAGHSQPRPGPDGQPDLRSAAARRADALLEVLGRGVSTPTEGPPAPKTQVVVTIPLAHLQEKSRGLGVTETGQTLSPTVVRRLACDARIIPMVLGSEGEPLDVGRAVRLFTPGQRRAVARRDHRCTYPGCTIPAGWCDVHHLQHWVHGGATDLSNAALLCGRHHTLVHQRDMTATVDDDGVTWHR